MDNPTREERIKFQAHLACEYHRQQKDKEDSLRDYYEGEHAVNAEDWVALREGQVKYIRQHSKAKC